MPLHAAYGSCTTCTDRARSPTSPWLEAAHDAGERDAALPMHVAPASAGLTGAIAIACADAQMWSARPPTASAASFTASGSVGWAWTERAMSSALAPSSIATTNSAMMALACGPTT